MNYENMERSELVKLANERRGPANYDVWDKPMLIAFLKNPVPPTSSSPVFVDATSNTFELIEDDTEYDDDSLYSTAAPRRTVLNFFVGACVLITTVSLLTLWFFGLVSLALQGFNLIAGWFA